MRINVLQHTPNEGVGAIGDWAKEKGHDLYIYHPYFYNGILPKAEETDLLIVLGGPMSPNDLEDWIFKERELTNFSFDSKLYLELYGRGENMLEYKIDVIKELDRIGVNTTIAKKTGIFGQTTMKKFREKDTSITLDNLNRLCAILEMQPRDIIKYVETEDDREKIISKIKE